MRARARKGFVSLAIVAVIVFGVAEAYLQFSPESRPSADQDRIKALFVPDPGRLDWWVPDDDLGFLVKPQRHENIVTKDYTYDLETDRFGFSNREPWSDDVDAVFLGDSLLIGVGVGIDGQFSTLVADRLDDLSVLNFGLPGGSPEHMLRIYRRFAAERRPELVFACLYVASDVNNARQFDAWMKVGQQWTYQEFRMERFSTILPTLLGNKSSKPAGGPAEAKKSKGIVSGLRDFLLQSAVIKESLYVLDPWTRGVLRHASFPDGARVFLYRKAQQNLSNGLALDYPSIDEIFFNPLVELRSIVESTGGRMVVVLIPSKEEIFAVDGYEDTLRIIDYVKGHLADLDMPVLDLYPAIRDSAQDTAPFHPHDIHLNAVGNEVVAAEIATWIRQQNQDMNRAAATRN